jgi:ribonuclease Z
VHIHELKGGETFDLPGNLHASCILASHGVPCLAYRAELARRPEFQVEKAKALGLPVQLWSRLQHGQTVEYNGQTIEPAQVLGEPRRSISFAFITDTRPTKALVKLASDVDLLICESMYDNPEDIPLARMHGHMYAEESASILTHFSPKINDSSQAERAARRVFPNTRAARDGMIVSLDFS